MAGYGGQLVALNVNTPSETELAAAQAAEANTRAQVAKATAPADIQIKNEMAQSASMQNQMQGLGLQQQMQLNAYRQHMLARVQGADQSSYAPSAQSPLAAATPLFDPSVEQVLQGADPSDPASIQAANDKMAELAKTVPQAQQFVGRINSQTLPAWRSQIGVHAINASQQSPLAQQGPAQAQPASFVSPINGQEDPDIAAMSVIDPTGTQKFLQMQGMMKYQQTGDTRYLARFAPDLFKTLADAQNTMTTAQKTALETRTSQMGQAANGVLALAQKLGPDAPEVRAAYNDAVTNAARNGWISPQVAQQELASPIDFGNLSYLATTSQTVAQWAKSSGTEAANEARAKAENMPVHTAVVPGVTDAAGNPIFFNENAAPTGGFNVSGNLTQGLNDFVARINHYEGGGNPNAKNPMSSAQGLGQFTDGTWLSMMKQARPDLTQGKSDAQILALKTDPALSQQMTAAYAQQNAARLTQQGIPVMGATLGAAHSIGPANTEQLMASTPNTPMTKILSPEEAKANPQWARMTTGQFIQSMGQKYGTTPISLNGAAQGSNLTGQAYINTLPQAMKNDVQAVIDGRMEIPNTGRQTPWQQQVLRNVMQADPNFDFVNAPARKDAFKQFTGNGRAAQVASSGNRLAYHLNDLYADSQALVGPELGFGPLNTAAASIGQSFQPAAVARYKAVLPFIAGELQKLTKNGSATVEETKHIMDNLQPNQSAATRLAAIQQTVELAQGQFKPFRDQWASLFPNKNPPVDFTPTTTKIFDHITNGQDPIKVDHNGNEIAPAGANLPTLSPEQARAVPKGTRFRTTDGRVMVRQ